MLSASYRGFISYAHEDRAHALWLLRAIESYRVPPSLPLPPGVPRRIRPVFLDRLELRADGRLDATLLEAMRRSDSLLVLCSPSAVASGKVDEEIRAFAALGRADRIFPLIVAGHPDAAARGYPAGSECFPVALRALSGAPAAADIRPGKGTRREALVRIVASMLGVRRDDLQRRDERRRVRRLAGATAAALVLATVTSLLGISAWLARAEAERERQRAVHTATFLKDLLQGADPDHALGEELTARELVDEGSVLLQGEGVPAELRTDMRVLLSGIYGSLGVGERARQLADEALLERGRTSKDDAAYAEALELNAALDLEDGLLDQARVSQSRVVEIRERLRDRAGAAKARSLLGAILLEAGQLDDAHEQLQRALQDLLLQYPEGDREIVQTYNRIATLQQERRAMPQAIESFQRALEAARQVHGPVHSGVATMLNNLALAHKYANQFDAAESLYQQSLAMRRQLYGDEHPAIAMALNNLATLARDRGDVAGALPILNESLAMNRRLFGEPHPRVALNLYNLGLLFTRAGEHEEALRALRAAGAQRASLFGPEHPRTAQATGALAPSLLELGRTTEAVAAAAAVVRVYESAYGPAGTQTSGMRAWLGEAHLEAGQFGLAAQQFGMAFDACDRADTGSESDCNAYALGAAEAHLLRGAWEDSGGYLARFTTSEGEGSWRHGLHEVLQAELRLRREPTSLQQGVFRAAVTAAIAHPDMPRHVVRRLSARGSL